MKTLVHEKAGTANTLATLEIAAERAQLLGITQVVVASSHGYTAREANRLLAPLGIQVIAVSRAEASCSTKQVAVAKTKAHSSSVPNEAPARAAVVIVPGPRNAAAITPPTKIEIKRCTGLLPCLFPLPFLTISIAFGDSSASPPTATRYCGIAVRPILWTTRV